MLDIALESSTLLSSAFNLGRKYSKFMTLRYSVSLHYVRGEQFFLCLQLFIGLSDNNGTRIHNHLACKGTLNNLAKLACFEQRVA